MTVELETPAARKTPPESRPRRRRRSPPRDVLLPLLGLLPAIALGVRSFMLPWARARVLLVFGVSRSATAQALVILALAGTIAATVAIAGRTRLRLVAFVHLATGALLCGVAWLAFSMVRHAGVRALGVLPVAAVRPGPGLRHFVLAALCVVALGLVELVVALLRRRAPSSSTSIRRSATRR
jgi:hypothetical protein